MSVKKLFVLLATCFLSDSVIGQSTEFLKNYAEAESLLKRQQYALATDAFLKLSAEQPSNSAISFKTGLAILLGNGDRTRSIPHLEKAVKNIGTDSLTSAPVSAHLHLAEAYHLAYRFDEAKTQLTLLEASNQADPGILAKAAKMKSSLENARTLYERPIKVNILNLGPAINSVFKDYAPVLTADEEMIIFTSQRPRPDGKLDWQSNYFEELYISIKDQGQWKHPLKLDLARAEATHTSTVALSDDGQKLFVYMSEGAGSGDLYESSLTGDKWSLPRPLSTGIRNDNKRPTLTISSDGQSIYFSSDKPGGYGGMDLYMIQKLPNGEWSLPVNLGPLINTPADEVSPFLHAEGRILFFSSDGQPGIGGFDIFFSQKSASGSWEAPMNIGYPLNTSGDDQDYVLSADGKRAYYSSNSMNGAGDKDLYVADFVENREKPMALVKGQVKSYYGGIPDNIEIVVTDNESGELYGIYYPNARSGKYLFILPTGRNYYVTYEASGYLFHSENLNVSASEDYYEFQRSIDLNPLTVGSRTVLNNILFESGSSSLPESAKTELMTIRKLFDESPNLYIEISGHSDKLEEEDGKKELSEKRADVVVAELVKMGVPPSRIKAIGYGNLRPVAGDAGDGRTPDSQGNGANRRVELKILGTD